MNSEKMVFLVDFFALQKIKSAFNGEIIKSKGGFAEGISPYQIEIREKSNARIYGLLVFWRENLRNHITCEIHIFDAPNMSRYRATCFLYRQDAESVKSFVNALNAKIGRFCMLQNISFVEKKGA